jgi:transcriptional regulator GlxA family with amidase domain
MSETRPKYTKTYGIYVVPGFAMMAFSAVLEPLRAANLISNETLYRWHLVSRDGGFIAPSTGLKMVADHSIDNHLRYDRIVVCTGGSAHLFDDARTFAWLRRAARSGTELGAVADGSFVLAHAGLLDGYDCAIHWQCHPGFHETFPHIPLSGNLYVIDRDRFTCAGGVGAFDMMLDVIDRDHGRALARHVAKWFVHDRMRADTDRERLALRVRIGVTHPTVLSAIALMEESIEEPIKISRLAELSGVSLGRLERLFRSYAGMKPIEYYMQIRLERAHALIAGTALSVQEVSLACGFVSVSHFGRRYHQFFHQTPGTTRRGIIATVKAMSSNGRIQDHLIRTPQVAPGRLSVGAKS